MTDKMQFSDPLRRTPEKDKIRRRRSFWRKFFLVVGIVLLTCAGALFYISGFNLANSVRIISLIGGYANDKIHHTPPFKGKTQVNILLLGTDVSFGDSARTDTMKLVTIDFRAQRISMLSIPRDTWVTLPNGREGRINSAHQLGGNNRQLCVKMAETAVTDLLSDLNGAPIHIDGYVRVQADRFAGLVDALGGIDIDVEKQMDYEDPSQDLFIHLRPGLQHLNGRQTMGYVRFRHDSEGDYGRIRRQDKFLRTLASQMNKPGRKVQMIGPMLKLVSTDISANDALAIKELASKVGMDGIQSVELPTVPTYKGAASVVEIQDQEAAALAVKELLNGPRPTVLVLNGTKQSGLARTVSDSIGEDTFNVVGLGTTKAPVPLSTVFAPEKYKQAAEQLAQRLGLATVVNTQNPPPPAKVDEQADTPPATPPQITVVIGKDYQRVEAASAQPSTGSY